MELKLTNDEKCELLGINLEELCKDIQQEIFMKELFTIKNDEIDLIQTIVGDSIELEIDFEVPKDNVRVGFYSFNNQVIVIKRKKINIKLLIDLLIHLFEISVGNTETRIGVVLNIMVKMFLNVLDEDVAIVYSYLCNEYFINGSRYNNEEIFDELNKYLKRNLGGSWSNSKINKILLQLEDLGVIEFSDGILYVKDKIYFS